MAAKKKATKRSTKKDKSLSQMLAELPAGEARSTTGRKGTSLDLETKGLWLSIHQFCQETGKDRASVDKKIRLGIITPIKGAKGQPLYKLRDLIDLTFYRDDAGKVDIDRLDPFRRKAHYSAELDKLKMLRESGQLIPASQVEAEQARVAKILTQFLDTLPDILERDCGASATLLQKIEQRIDSCREDLHRQIIGDEPEGEEQCNIVTSVPTSSQA
jgi:hypothetical protein